MRLLFGCELAGQSVGSRALTLTLVGHHSCSHVPAGEGICVLLGREHAGQPLGSHVCCGLALNHPAAVHVHLHQRPRPPAREGVRAGPMLHRLGGLLSAPERDSVSGSMETLRQHLCSVHKPPWLGKVLEIRELPTFERIICNYAASAQAGMGVLVPSGVGGVQPCPLLSFVAGSCRCCGCAPRSAKEFEDLRKPSARYARPRRAHSCFWMPCQ